MGHRPLYISQAKCKKDELAFFFVKFINIARSSLRHGALDLNICRISLVESESVLWILVLLLENVEY